MVPDGEKRKTRAPNERRAARTRVMGLVRRSTRGIAILARCVVSMLSDDFRLSKPLCSQVADVSVSDMHPSYDLEIILQYQAIIMPTLYHSERKIARQRRSVKAVLWLISGQSYVLLH